MDGLTFTIAIILLTLTVARVTRLITADMITDQLRINVAKFTGADSGLSYFLSCAWCVSAWVAGAASAIFIMVTGVSWWWILVLAPATSHITGLLTALDPDEVEIIDG